MTFKRFFLTILCLILLSPCASFAKEEPIIYTVKQGDTLWDISQRFIKDPYYWPNLWSNNPDIGNPHLIYPGQKLRIYDGRIEIIPVGEPTSEIGAAVITPEEIFLIPTYGGARSFVSNGEVASLGTLVDTVDNRVLISEGDTVFLEMKDLASIKPGDVYELFTLGEKLFHPGEEKKFGHQLSDHSIGFQTIQLGTVEIKEITPHVAVAIVTDALQEIQRGAKLRPYRRVPDRIPRTLADISLEGYILTNDESHLAMGQWDVILIDIGEENGLQVGNELDLFRKRQATEQADPDKNLILPDIDLGDAIVLEVRPGFAEAMITRTTNLPLYRGDQVRTKVK